MSDVNSPETLSSEMARATIGGGPLRVTKHHAYNTGGTVVL
jgi:hypothetical protein